LGWDEDQLRARRKGASVEGQADTSAAAGNAPVLFSRVSGKSVDEFVRLALSLVYPSECCIVSHTTELLDSTQKAHFSQFRQPVCHTPYSHEPSQSLLQLTPG